jgi:hypothetical protein
MRGRCRRWTRRTRGHDVRHREQESKRGCAQAAPTSTSAKLGRAPRHECSAGGEDQKGVRAGSPRLR